MSHHHGLGDSCRSHGEMGSCCSSGSCGCNGSSSQGKSCHCSQCSCCSGKEDHSQKLLDLANAAWMEVLKERMKEIIRSQDTKIQELAQIVCEANKARWQHKTSAKQGCMKYEEKLKHLMGCSEDRSCGSSSCSK